MLACGDTLTPDRFWEYVYDTLAEPCTPVVVLPVACTVCDPGESVTVPCMLEQVPDAEVKLAVTFTPSRYTRREAGEIKSEHHCTATGCAHDACAPLQLAEAGVMVITGA